MKVGSEDLNNDMNITFYGKDRPAARYVSGTTVREEALDHTRMVGLYWSASGQVQRENVAARLPDGDPRYLPSHVFELEIDGQSLHNRWEWVSSVERAGKRDGTREAVVELRHQVRPVTVKMVTRLDGSDFMVRYLEITNTGDSPAALSHVSPWSGMLWQTSDHWGLLPSEAKGPFSLGHFAGAGWGTEGDFVWETLPPGRRRIESGMGRSGSSNPFFMVRNEITGENAIGSLAWSANWFAEFWYDPAMSMENTPATNLGFRMGPLGPAPLRVIAPGEMVTSPEMHLAVLHAGFDECVASLHEHIRTSVVPPRPKGKEMFTIGGRMVEEPDDWMLREMDIAADMGVDAFMIDAGWYGDKFGDWWSRRGDWEAGPWMPGGLLGCREHAHKLGLLFGLWMEPESIGPESKHVTEHPDWILKSDGPAESRDVAGGGPIDMANPEAAKFVTDSILRLVGDNKLDFFKTDYNVLILEGGQRDRDGYAEHESWRHYEALYGVFDSVLDEFPEVALEDCAAGGGRIDLGMLSRTHYACESDASQFPRSIRAINGLTMFVPPESLCYYHNHIAHAHQKADLDTHLRVTLFAQPIFVGFGAQDADRTTEYFQKTRRYIRLIKEFTGPILAGKPRVIHHTPNVRLQTPADWLVLEYAAQDASAGYAGIFRLSGLLPGGDEYVFKPNGVDVSATYAVTLDNSGKTVDVTGADLAFRGIPVRLTGSYTSELVMYRLK